MPVWSSTGLNLGCYPSLPEHVAQPWDAADEYLLQEVPANKSHLIINDRFGALFCAFPESFCWIDSASARYSWVTNAEKNNLNAAGDRIIKTPSALTITPEHTLIKIPKSFDQLCYWLDIISAQAPDCVIWLAGMAKHIPVKWLQQLEKLSTNYRQYPIAKKARLLRITDWQGSDTAHWIGYRTDSGVQLEGLPGVFSRERQDIASYPLLGQITTPHSGDLLDIGCGNGLLGLTLLKRSPQLKLTAVDDSQYAVESCLHNARLNQLEASVVHNDSLNGLQLNADIIVCNPPFHDGHRQTTDIANRMFADAARVLTQSGEFWVVANRHLPYIRELKVLFRKVENTSADAKFNVFRCQQPRDK